MDTPSLPTYTAEPVLDDGILMNIRLSIAGKTWHLWGRNGMDRETTLARACPTGVLPVLLGAGLGHCLRELAERGPVAVVDREASIRKLTGVLKPTHENITLIDTVDPQQALLELARWRQANGAAPLHPVRFSLYQRLAPAYYGLIAKTLETETQTDFWQQAQYPKFQNTKPRILFFKAKYFLSNEICNALSRLDVPYEAFQVETGGVAANDYVESLLKAILRYKPDFVLTVNHFGLDREGKITGMLERMGLPLASWFVDNPHLILYRYKGLDASNVVLFSFDASNLTELSNAGFRNVHYLPLATDSERFKPGLAPKFKTWRSAVSFVGNSMTTAVDRTLRQAAPSPLLRKQYTEIAAAFGESEEVYVSRFIERSYPELAEEIARSDSIERQLALESLITWESTRLYRLKCIQATLEFSPLIVGDQAWKTLLPDDGSWRHLPLLHYYKDLPAFYPCSDINFNCTSLQMKGAVNQRVFDVPACGGFLLTDYRAQMETLFEPETEVAIYNDVNEISERISHFLRHPAERKAISVRARKRILAHHTYTQRLTSLAAIMRKQFS